MSDERPTISLADFVDDKPWVPQGPEYPEVRIGNQIEGVTLHRLEAKADGRGNLVVLMSDRFGENFQAPHIYLVTAAPRSVRAWVYHKRQHDRLAFTMGKLRAILYDLRPDSPTHGVINEIDAGAENQIMLTIPPFVVHAVQNPGDEAAFFVNMPTRAYDPANPDKSRVPADHPGIPYRFE
ncbi:MAG: dTDP-4-dehydrorhamnose 3,5-epimerase family protein [Tabrizicola sp.]|nr:dTDP-4-dehydrorhamnose 3,5-epimerase family protein [Tabrizicola sp.]